MSKSWETLKAALVAKGDVRGFKSEFARQLGVPPQSVQRYFNPDDTTVPSMDQADKIAAALGLRLEVSKTAPELQKTGPKLVADSTSSLLGDAVRLLVDLDDDELRAVLPYIQTAPELAAAARPGQNEKLTQDSS